MIWTSYFGNYKQFPSGAYVVSITRFPPKNWNRLEMKSLAPSEELLKQYKSNQIDEKIFKWKYLQEIEDRGIDKSSLRNFFNSLGDVILCCYEKDGFCHRHILNEWIGGDGELNKS